MELASSQAGLAELDVEEGAEAEEEALAVAESEAEADLIMAAVDEAFEFPGSVEDLLAGGTQRARSPARGRPSRGPPLRPEPAAPGAPASRRGRGHASGSWRGRHAGGARRGRGQAGGPGECCAYPPCSAWGWGAHPASPQPPGSQGRGAAGRQGVAASSLSAAASAAAASVRGQQVLQPSRANPQLEGFLRGAGQQAGLGRKRLQERGQPVRTLPEASRCSGEQEGAAGEALRPGPCRRHWRAPGCSGPPGRTEKAASVCSWHPVLAHTPAFNDTARLPLPMGELGAACSTATETFFHPSVLAGHCLGKGRRGGGARVAGKEGDGALKEGGTSSRPLVHPHLAGSRAAGMSLVVCREGREGNRGAQVTPRHSCRHTPGAKEMGSFVPTVS